MLTCGCFENHQVQNTEAKMIWKLATWIMRYAEGGPLGSWPAEEFSNETHVNEQDPRFVIIKAPRRGLL